MLTTMAIFAQRHNWDIRGTRAHVVKEMISAPVRRIASLTVTITFPKPYPEEQRTALESIASACPVHQSLHPDISKPVRFVYPA